MKRCGLGRDVETTPGMSGRISEPPVVAGSAVNITQGLDVIVCQSVSTLCTAVNLQQFTSPSQYALPSVFLNQDSKLQPPPFFPAFLWNSEFPWGLRILFRRILQPNDLRQLEDAQRRLLGSSFHLWSLLLPGGGAIRRWAVADCLWGVVAFCHRSKFKSWDNF